MGVDRLFDDDARALTRQLSMIDGDAHLRSIYAALDADDAAQDSADTDRSPLVEMRIRKSAEGSSTMTDQTIGQRADQAPTSRPDAEQFGTWPDNELAHCLRQAEEGDAASARRVAELLELMDNDAEAAVWWERAVASGDPDATIYIEGSPTT